MTTFWKLENKFSYTMQLSVNFVQISYPARMIRFQILPHGWLSQSNLYCRCECFSYFYILFPIYDPNFNKLVRLIDFALFVRSSDFLICVLTLETCKLRSCNFISGYQMIELIEFFFSFPKISYIQNYFSFLKLRIAIV